MKLRIHQVLFAGFALVIGVVVLGTVLLSGRALQDELTELSREELRRKLGLGEMVLQRARGEDLDSLAGLVTRRIGHRVTIIGIDGRVLGDSDITRDRLAEVENHGDRPEVRAALASHDVAFSRRVSATVERDLLYAARPAVVDGDTLVLRLSASLAEIERATSSVRSALLAAALVALVVALGLSYLLSRVLASPLGTLAQRARKMAEGDLGTRAPGVRRIVELEELAASFNRLAEELAAHLTELSRDRDEMRTLIDSMAEGVIALTADARVLRINRAAVELLDLPDAPQFAPVGTVVRDPELRELLERSVVRPFRAREVALGECFLLVSSRVLDRGGSVVTFLDVTEMRRLERVRRDFVANASHELKTPLTTIRGFAETLLEEEPPPHLKEEFLAAIRNNTERLQHLVDDLLDLSRLESGGWTATEEPVDAAAAARAAWTDFGGRAQEKEISFEVDGAATVLADEQGLDRVFRNLFDNAIRFSDQGGSIRVSVEERKGMAEISVSDTGSGIPSTALPRIFERFYRVDAHRGREHGGTGLGLSIVRHLVQAMGGEVEAESVLGEGTTVRFTVPAAARRDAGADA